ncbi:hypothetical protein ANCCEY_07570 [Ancylostoma ceylanicum]|uniref:Uncharacterized protein n=1 Tax=Ancylostoma ceylanicum TaxID=53326 RepID=A0A0D6LNC1_9BILA|nr:hypothetical protein ANCCEY_07570 [Ancylostoma ceylanicum]
MRLPNEKDDATFVEIEPTSGVPIRAKRRVQINVGLTKGDLKHLAYTVGVSFLTVGLLIFFITVVTVVIYTVLKPRMEDEQPILQEESVEEEVGDI